MIKFETNDRGGWVVPDGTKIPAKTQIPVFSQLGDGCTLGDWCTLGDGCTLEGVKVIWFMTAANIDGSGRQIIIIQHADGFRIRAGCFVGTLDEFCDKADADGKTVYKSVVRAICDAREGISDATD